MKKWKSMLMLIGTILIIFMPVIAKAGTTADYKLKEGLTNLGAVSNLRSQEKEPGMVYNTTALFTAPSSAVYQIKTSGCKESEFMINDTTSGKSLDG